MKFTGIVLLCIGAAIAYGILHDQVTTRVCVEYFTIAHPKVIASNSPTVLGLFWGIAATWWVGLALGLLLAAASRLGAWPKLDWTHQRAGIARLLILMASLAFGAALLVWLNTCGVDPSDLAHLTGARIPALLRSRFLAVWSAHLVSYGVGSLGGLALVTLTLLRRRRLARVHEAPRQ